MTDLQRPKVQELEQEEEGELTPERAEEAQGACGVSPWPRVPAATAISSPVLGSGEAARQRTPEAPPAPARRCTPPQGSGPRPRSRPPHTAPRVRFRSGVFLAAPGREPPAL
jgi:hypothetical protein